MVNMNCAVMTGTVVRLAALADRVAGPMEGRPTGAAREDWATSGGRLKAVPEQSKTEGGFGPNAWLVDEMYEQYRQDPSSVSASWREFFADYKRPGTARSETTNGQ